MRRFLPHPSVRTEGTPINLTPALLDFPLSGAQLHLSAGPHLPTPHAATAHGHTPNQHRSCNCSSCPSTHRECGDRVGHFHHSSRRAVSPLGPVPTHNHFVIRTGCSCQSANEAKATPLCSCAPRCGQSAGHSDNSTLARTSWHRLSFQDPCVKITWALLHISEARPVPATSCREALSDSRMQTQPPQSPLPHAFYCLERSRPFASTIRALCEL